MLLAMSLDFSGWSFGNSSTRQVFNLKPLRQLRSIVTIFIYRINTNTQINYTNINNRSIKQTYISKFFDIDNTLQLNLFPSGIFHIIGGLKCHFKCWKATRLRKMEEMLPPSCYYSNVLLNQTSRTVLYSFVAGTRQVAIMPKPPSDVRDSILNLYSIEEHFFLFVLI